MNAAAISSLTVSLPHVGLVSLTVEGRGVLRTADGRTILTGRSLGLKSAANVDPLFLAACPALERWGRLGPHEVVSFLAGEEGVAVMRHAGGCPISCEIVPTEQARERWRALVAEGYSRPRW